MLIGFIGIASIIVYAISENYSDAAEAITFLGDAKRNRLSMCAFFKDFMDLAQLRIEVDPSLGLRRRCFYMHSRYEYFQCF